jgi:Ca2+-binding EF-hand superfamily protein
MYDTDRDGYISRGEMTKVFNELFTMMGDIVSLQGDEHDTPKKLVEKIYSDFNTTKNGMLTFEEFKIGSLRDPAIMNPLNFM